MKKLLLITLFLGLGACAVDEQSEYNFCSISLLGFGEVIDCGGGETIIIDESDPLEMVYYPCEVDRPNAYKKEKVIIRQSGTSILWVNGKITELINGRVYTTRDNKCEFYVNGIKYSDSSIFW